MKGLLSWILSVEIMIYTDDRGKIVICFVSMQQNLMVKSF